MTAIVQRGVIDLRGEAREDSELVDQAHFGENLRLLGEDGAWRYVQGADQYFGWALAADLHVMTGYGEAYYVAVLLADVRERPDPGAEVVARLPAGASIPEIRASAQEPGGGTRAVAYHHPAGWRELPGPGRAGFVSSDDLVDARRLPHRNPTAADYLKTAEAFMGVPYLWGGTTALGLDRSGFVQQVYRLNGVALPRDADQQSTLGRRVDEARAGDLFFFGAESVTHVALATSATEFVHAPMKGGVVETGRLGGDRRLRGIRRYLP
ncbi:MAG TPA: C40 family peptidase [Candidatus Limnocylindria bacterium]|nr:C40 family peptidase [Candidatus Limnocylindria bacterium]